MSLYSNSSSSLKRFSLQNSSFGKDSHGDNSNNDKNEDWANQSPDDDEEVVSIESPNRLDSDMQDVFKMDLERRGRAICIAISQVTKDDANSLEVESGEFLQLLLDLGNNLWRVQNAAGQIGNVHEANLQKISEEVAPSFKSPSTSRASSRNSSFSRSDQSRGAVLRSSSQRPSSNIQTVKPSQERKSNSSPSSVLGPRRLKDYTEIKKLEAGSFGRTKLVSRNWDAKTVVLKIIKLDGLNDDKFYREAEVLAKHPHEYIVKYEDSFRDKGKLVIETEYCSRGNLRTFINGRKVEKANFTENRIRLWTQQISLALLHLHNLSIIHRDVKAENIFLTENLDVKLGDLGSASELNSTIQGTSAQTLVGTFPYLAPEVANLKPYGVKIDIWSLGVLVYFLAALEYPFGSNMVETLRALIDKKRPPNLSTRSRELKMFIDKLLTYDPLQRPDIRTVLRHEFLAVKHR